MPASASPKKTTSRELLTYGGEVVHMKAERLSLTEMWKAAGSDPSKQPAKWRDLPSTKEFVSYIAEVILQKSEDEVFNVTRGGKSPSTWAHWQVAMNYARYLDPAFAAKCNVAVRDMIEGHAAVSALSLADDDRALSVIGSMIKKCTGVALRDALPTIADEVVRRLPGPAASTVVALADYRPATKVPAGVAELISTHRTLVHIDEAMFGEDDQPKGDGHIASGQAERFAFCSLMAAPCRDMADVTAKVDYLLNGTIGDRDSLVDVLLGGLDRDDPSLTDPASPLMLLLKSLVCAEGDGGQR